MKNHQSQDNNTTRRNRLFQISIIATLILILTPSTGRFHIIYVDKLVHFGLFLILSINACYKYQNLKFRTEALIWIMLFGLVTEIIQQFVPGRDMDIYDGIADTLGVISGYYIYQKKQPGLDYSIQRLGA